MLLDKTGTLTYGKPHVALIDPADGYEPDELFSSVTVVAGFGAWLGPPVNHKQIPKTKMTT